MFYDILNNDTVWTIYSVLWFVFVVVFAMIVFVPSNIHLWKFGKVAIFPCTFFVNFSYCIFTKWFISIPFAFLITWVVYKAYDYQIGEIYNWEKRGGYALNIFKLKKQLKEFSSLTVEEQASVLKKSPSSKEDMKISLLKMVIVTVIPNSVISAVIAILVE